MVKARQKPFKAWAGRITGSTHSLVEKFTRSLGFDQRLAPFDVEGSIAHCKMLVKQGILSRREGEQILKGLRKIGDELREGRVKFLDSDEDIHMAVERLLTEKIGPAGGKLHTARSRNDQVALDMKLFLRSEIDQICPLVSGLQRSLADLARKHRDVIMPGYTHLQQAQPILFSHYLLAYWEMLERDHGRLLDCRRRADEMPLGSGALAGTGFAIDRHYVARLLGFSRVSRNSIDAVSDRDFLIEFISAATILCIHLSRMAEDWIIWSTAEFDFIEIPDAFSTGSSMMPQKKNPDVLELVRGKAARVSGHLATLVSLLKGVPLAYNRDLQEDKEPLFDTVDTVKSVLMILCGLVPNLEVKRENMLKRAGGFSLATDLADYLAQKGMPFREAHSVMGQVVNHCLETGGSLEALSLEEWRRFSPLFGKEVFALLSPKEAVARRNSFGGTSPRSVERRLKEIGAAH
jgi:argininosuccinate lyase